MKGIFLSLGLTIVLACSAFAAPQCHTSELEKCGENIMKWMHTLPKRSLPETTNELDTMCKELGEGLDCLMKYRDSCMTPIQKELQTIVSEGLVDLRKNFCTAPGPVRQNYEKHAPCLNKLSQSDEVVNMLQYIMVLVEKTHGVATNDVLTYGCCGYRKMYNAFVKLGNDNCGVEATQSILDIIKMAMSELPDILCNGFVGNEPKCTALLPPEGSKPSPDALGIEFYKFLQDLFKQWIE